MLRVSVSARRTARKGFVSSAAMALALACGGIVASAGIAAPAAAQEYSKEWRTLASPVSDAIDKADKDPAVTALITQISSADGAARQALVAQADAALGGVLAQLGPVVTLAKTPDEIFTTGQFHLNFGNKFRDLRLQRTGLKMMVDSGKAPPEQLPLLTYYVGSISFDFKEYDFAREYLKKAYDLGHKQDNIEQLIAETYFETNQGAQGLAEVDRMVAERGAAIPKNLYLRALEVARDDRMTDQIPRRAAELVRYYPDEGNWVIALNVLLESIDFTADESLDIFRLMRLTNSMRDGRAYVNYVEAADARRMASEVLPVLQDGIRLGAISDQDPFVKEALEVATARAPEDAAAAEEDAVSARTSTDAISARAAADNYYALGNFAGAEELYKLALQRAPEDADRLNMRIGISQARQGKAADARTSFQAVKGKRAYVATLWLGWLDSQGGS